MRQIVPSQKIEKIVPFILIVGGVIGFTASFILTVDEFKLLKNPGYTPGCNISPIISCGSIMKTEQSAVLGFPNSLIGIGAFAAIIAIGLALVSGAKLPKRFWQTLLAGVAVAAVFVHWLIFQSLYRIGSLCPFCMAVWAATIAIFWYLVLYNLSFIRSKGSKLVRLVQKHHGDVLVVWLLIIAALILKRFWYYWQTLV